MLQNAIRYNGTANPGAIVGKVFGENPDLRKNAKDVQAKIKSIVAEVNKLGVEVQTAELQKLAPELLEKPEKKEGLKDLPGAVSGKVVMRMAPSPSGPLHIGHSYVTSLNYEYVKKYGGKFYFRIEDTNPSNIYEPAYDLIPDDAQWITEDGVAEFIIQSDRIQIYYDYAEKLFEKGLAYVCDCDPEEARDLLKKSMACPCRDLTNEEQDKRWRKMFTDYDVGQAVMRFKSDINHKNPAMRDFPLFRINKDTHPRVGNKYTVWPLMNMSVAIDDLELGMTHTLRGKDHADNAKRQEMIHHALGHKTPLAISVGRINFEGLELSTTKTKERIKTGEFSGWDDIRLATLLALRRRGYTPEALRKYAIEVGVTKTDKSVAVEEFFKTINSFNKEILESKSYRYSFVADPVQIFIEGAPEFEVELNLHPENKKGGRQFTTSGKFFISKDDFDSIKEGQIARLIDCYNFKKEGEKFVFVSQDLNDYRAAGSKKGAIINWVVDDNELSVDVRMPDNTIVSGLGEKWLNDVAEGTVVQFERFGFVRCDTVNDDKTEFWFTHK